MRKTYTLTAPTVHTFFASPNANRLRRSKASERSPNREEEERECKLDLPTPLLSRTVQWGPRAHRSGTTLVRHKQESGSEEKRNSRPKNSRRTISMLTKSTPITRSQVAGAKLVSAHDTISNAASRTFAVGIHIPTTNVEMERHRNRHLSLNWQTWNGNPWDLQQISHEYQRSSQTLNRFEEGLKQATIRKANSVNTARSKLDNFLYQYYKAWVDLERSLLPFWSALIESCVIYWLIDGFVLHHTRHGLLKLKAWLVSSRTSMFCYPMEVLHLRRAKEKAVILSYDPANFHYQSLLFQTYAADAQSRAQLKVAFRNIRWAMKLQNSRQNGRRTLTNELIHANKELWPIREQNKNLRRLLDHKMNTLWDAHPRVWSAESLTAALRSNAKRTFIEDNRVRLDLQSFYYRVPGIPKSKAQIVRRKAFWVCFHDTLLELEKKASNLVELVHDYRALVLWRSNLFPHMTTQRDIQLGKDCSSLRLGTFSPEGFRGSSPINKTSSMMPKQDNGMLVVGFAAEHSAGPSLSKHGLRRGVEKKIAQAKTHSPRHTQLDRVQGFRKHPRAAMKGFKDISASNTPKGNSKLGAPRPTSTKPPTLVEGQRSSRKPSVEHPSSAVVSNDIMSVLRAAQFHP
ncbi:hypothetical protein EJ02DRAFT_514943 [Clathrospora elynae]|uniref:Uncharacterized protein n=1 Tax=Clathrospora elynae TaxID=706981 RepID=A0A6A5SDV4_9PLEO|nr:hypothetical protein EJ02DRAFT_514943 [Clathrospora elynae]